MPVPDIQTVQDEDAAAAPLLAKEVTENAKIQLSNIILQEDTSLDSLHPGDLLTQTGLLEVRFYVVLAISSLINGSETGIEFHPNPLMRLNQFQSWV